MATGNNALFNYIRTGTQISSFDGVTNGGYLLPEDAEMRIMQMTSEQSPIRSISSVKSISGVNFLSPQNISIDTHEMYCQPAATQIMLDDAAMDVEGWIGAEISRAFAAAESPSFVKGDGTVGPKGFLAYPTIENTSWTWGSLGFIATGAAGAFPASNPSDILVDLTHALKSQYRQNATFVMNRKTLSIIHKYKDSAGNYLWQAPTVAGAKSTLMNFPVVESEDMPDVAANSLSIAFGDFQRGYVAVDSVGIRTLRDPYSAKPYVLFYTTKRVGGGVQDFDAIKLLKFCA